MNKRHFQAAERPQKMKVRMGIENRFLVDAFWTVDCFRWPCFICESCGVYSIEQIIIELERQSSMKRAIGRRGREGEPIDIYIYM